MEKVESLKMQASRSSAIDPEQDVCVNMWSMMILHTVLQDRS